MSALSFSKQVWITGCFYLLLILSSCTTAERHIVMTHEETNIVEYQTEQKK